MPHPVDIHIGQRMRARRRMLVMSQQTLADSCGITFQQIQEYENGANRVSGSKLWEIAKAMETDIGFFYEGLDETAVDGKVCSDLETRFMAEGGRPLAENFMTLPMHGRRAVMDLAHTLASVKHTGVAA